MRHNHLELLILDIGAVWALPSMTDREVLIAIQPLARVCTPDDPWHQPIGVLLQLLVLKALWVGQSLLRVTQLAQIIRAHEVEFALRPVSTLLAKCREELLPQLWRRALLRLPVACRLGQERLAHLLQQETAAMLASQLVEG